MLTFCRKFNFFYFTPQIFAVASVQKMEQKQNKKYFNQSNVFKLPV